MYLVQSTHRPNIYFLFRDDNREVEIRVENNKFSAVNTRLTVAEIEFFKTELKASFGNNDK